MLRKFYSLLALAGAVGLMAVLSGCIGGAASVASRIEAIGSVDESSIESLSEIEKAYQALSPEEKKKVGNYTELKDAIAKAEGMKNDRLFITALEDSVRNRMEGSDDEDFESLVNAELARLDEFRGCTFFDETISKASRQYLAGLDAQREALGKTEQYSDYQLLWNKGLVDRCAALNSLHEEHGFMEGDADFKADYILSFENKKKYYDALVAIEADLAAQLEADSIQYEWSYDGSTLTMTMMNNTDFAFDTVFEIDVVRDDGTVTETTQGFASAQPHARYAFTVYIADEAATHVNWNNWYSDIYV